MGIGKFPQPQAFARLGFFVVRTHYTFMNKGSISFRDFTVNHVWGHLMEFYCWGGIIEG